MKSKLINKNNRLKNTYGIDLDIWTKMYEHQNKACMICQKIKPVLCVDHRHVPKYKKLSPQEKAKEVRGLLCHYCNRLIGRVEHNKDCRNILVRIVAYFQVFKMKGDK